MKTVQEIYDEYKIMPSLQMHMLRVAAVASEVCDNFIEPINKEEIVLAALFHDMGNILKSKLELFPQYLEPEGLEYWSGVKEEYRKKYGDDEHNATTQILQNIGFSEKIIYLSSRDKFGLLCEHKNSKEMDVKILNYADNRVNPHSVVSYLERMEEAKERYKGHANYVENIRQELVDCGIEIEKQIFAKCKIRPEDITAEAATPIIEELRHFVIK